MTNSTSMEKYKWQSTLEIEEAQKRLVQALTTAPVLQHFDPEEPAIVETDASDFALGGILSQKHEGRLHPIVFHSRKFTEAEINYDTADKEILAIYYTGRNNVKNKLMYLSQGVFIAIELSLMNR